ncbi:MAG: hypothetical protein KJ721_03230 [Nanoarchaeota archaeon]|nr:hypothetical protein [Nanoarchaeota archaeon]
MKNRRGFLLAEEILKIVIALITISFLIYFLVSLYASYSTNKKLELAKASLEHLISEAEAGATEVEIYNPLGWWLYSWVAYDLPNSCSNLGWVKCLCACPEKSRKGPIEECSSYGVCLQSKFELVEDVQIKKPSVKLKIQDGKITQ